MYDDNIQQVFLCSVCGAQNVVGQQFCQACGERFQYNCPHCGFVVDPTLVTCPSCREALNWPTPQKVKAFPRQAGTHQAKEVSEEEDEEGKPKQKKADPWLIGCLGVIAVVVFAGAAYFVYDNFIQQAPSTIPYPVSGNTTGLKPMQAPEPEALEVMSSFIIPEDEA